MSDISKIQINGVLYDIDDAVARQALAEHTADRDIHITAAERSLWNTGRVTTKTTSEWNAERTYVPTAGYICVYSDYSTTTDESGNILNVPAIKVGDGTTHIVDLPFLIGTEAQGLLNQHIANTAIHITDAERTFWNNKISCTVESSNPEQIIFSTT